MRNKINDAGPSDKDTQRKGTIEGHSG